MSEPSPPELLSSLTNDQQFAVRLLVQEEIQHVFRSSPPAPIAEPDGLHTFTVVFKMHSDVGNSGSRSASFRCDEQTLDRLMSDWRQSDKPLARGAYRVTQFKRSAVLMLTFDDVLYIY